MGDDLETYRLRIGRHLSGGRVKRQNKYMTTQHDVFVSLLTSICFLSAVVIALCGNVEANSGPQTSKKYCAACHCCSAGRNTSYFLFPGDRLALNDIDTNYGHLLLIIIMCAQCMLYV